MTALTQPTPFCQRNAETREIFPFDNSPKFYPNIIHIFNFQLKQSLHFKLILFDHGTEIFQGKSHGRHDHHIPYRRRWGTHGHGANIPLDRWEPILNAQHNSGSPAWTYLSRLYQPANSFTIGTTVKYRHRDCLLPTNPKHVYDLWRWIPHEPHSKNWQPRTIYTADPTKTQSPNTILPPCATYPRHAEISDPGKSWAFRQYWSRRCS